MYWDEGFGGGGGEGVSFLPISIPPSQIHTELFIPLKIVSNRIHAQIGDKGFDELWVAARESLFHSK